MKKWLKRLGIGFVILVVAVVIIGVGVNLTSESDEQRRQRVAATREALFSNALATRHVNETREARSVPTPYVPAAPAKSIREDGRGDAVLSCTLSRGNYVVVVSHTGDRYFGVKFHDENGNQELVVNTSGAYNGSNFLRVGQDIAPGSCSVEITADGYWSIQIQPS